MNPERIIKHIGFFRADEFLRELFSWLALEWPPPPSEPMERFNLLSERQNIDIECHRLGQHPDFGEAELLVLDKVVFRRGSVLPYGLSPAWETKQTAQRKLSDDTAERDLDVSHFLSEALVVMVTFTSQQPGISSVTAVRLGVARDLRHR